MSEIESHLERIMDQMQGNEALLENLDEESAEEMLGWATEVAARIVKESAHLDDVAAEAEMAPRLRALRQVMRSVGNWTAGKYETPEDRARLRDRLPGHFKAIFGETATLPGLDAIERLVNEEVEPSASKRQRVSKFKELFKS